MADAPIKKEDEVPSRAPPAASPPLEVASDPEEDDLSDLDDVLDEFANTNLESKAPAASISTSNSQDTAAPSSSGPGRPEDTSPAELLLENEDEFAKQLQKEMEQLLGQGDFQKQFEDIMKEMSQEMGGANPLEATEGLGAKSEDKAKKASPPTESDKETAAKAEKSFQETIKKTMERMQSSSDTATSAVASSSQDDILAQMLASMEGGASAILMGMMEQLTNKDILYEPMKELDDKFPKWMEENRDKVTKDDLKRYEEQQSLVREIVGRFERKGYSDGNAGDREYIVERMQKMQAAGSPPPDLVGDMNAAQEALQDMDQGCPTQ
ncbi:Pex19 protein family-domain-containing protein [Pyrenochaeta sp. MPI-SDFR-AT-0127]|nr:Pex19 protein family-domain-containing protein [Pyrenochaeta sp. MPI-SDFR-AT-0127]